MKLSQFRLSALLAALAVASFAHPVRANVTGYAVDTSANLYRIDVTTATIVTVGSTGIAGFLEGLALSPTGQLYTTTSDGLLYSLDPSTAVATLIGNTGLGNVEGLDYRGNQLVGSNFDESPSFYAINPVDATATLIVTSTPQTGVARSFTIAGPNTALARTDGSSFGDLTSVDLTTGAATVLGALDVAPSYGMDFGSDGQLYGIGGAGEVFTINPTNGDSTLIGIANGAPFFLALALNPVPEPATLALVVCGGLALGAWSARRRV